MKSEACAVEEDHDTCQSGGQREARVRDTKVGVISLEIVLQAIGIGDIPWVEKQ